MLLDKIQRATQLIEDVSIAENEARIVKKLENFGKQIKALLPPKVESFSQALSVLHAHNPHVFPKQDLQFALAKLEELEAELEKEVLKEKALLELAKDVSDRQENLKLAWLRYAQESSDELMHLLRSLQGFVEQDPEIKQYLQSLETLRTRWPVNEKNVAHFADQLAKGKQKVSDLQVGSNIKSFLDKVTNKQATLDDLTDDVLQWLKEQQYTNRLTIRFTEGPR